MSEVQYKNIKKNFGSVEVLKDINLKINNQKFVVLLGPSGCGKTTLLRMTAGLEIISSGDISIEGKIINNIHPRDRDIAMVFQNYALYPQMNVFDNIALPSGGSLIIEHTEALTVIDVNTGKNVGKNNLEDTVFANNMEAAEEIAKQLRLRDIGGIIVIDFIDMEVKGNRAKVVDSFRSALSRDKTRTQVFDISELGLVEMTRKRIGEGLLTEFSERCPDCEGRGVTVDHTLLD